MKKTNKKGFTLIELLAVIVILAILITVAVPAVTQYLNTARKGTFVTNAQSAISAVRTDVISHGVTSNTLYKVVPSSGKMGINNLLESGKSLTKSTYDNSFDDSSFILVKFENGVASYHVCLIDSEGNGIAKTTTPAGGTATIDAANNYVAETTLSEASVFTGLTVVDCDATDATAAERDLD